MKRFTDLAREGALATDPLAALHTASSAMPPHKDHYRMFLLEATTPVTENHHIVGAHYMSILCYTHQCTHENGKVSACPFISACQTKLGPYSISIVGSNSWIQYCGNCNVCMSTSSKMLCMAKYSGPDLCPCMTRHNIPCGHILYSVNISFFAVGIHLEKYMREAS